MEIIALDQTWKGKRIAFHYLSLYHYAVALKENTQGANNPPLFFRAWGFALKL